MWHPTFLKRELVAGAKQLSLFVLCVFLASLSLSVVSGWRQSVDEALAEETKKGAGGDVVAFSTEPFSEELLNASEPYDPIFTSEMFTVSLALKTDLTLFSKLKAVELGYPYYGEVPLRSGRELHQALSEGLVVEERVLERLQVDVGDDVKVGDRVFKIADMALSEPDRPLGMWGVSPRIFIAFSELESTGLLREGAYLERRIHLKLPDPSKAAEVAEVLREAAIPDQERVETWERPPVNMEKYVNNFFTFLDMMVVLAVSLGGLGMQSTLSAWLQGRTKTVAITRTLGAKRRFIISHFTLLVLLCVLIGYVLGLAVAGVLLVSSGDYLTQMLPVRVAPRLSLFGAMESAFLCFVVSTAFSAWPLYETSQVRPGAILRDDLFKPSRLTRSLFALLVASSLFGLLAFLVVDLKRAANISLGLAVVAAVTGLVSSLLVRLFKRLRPRSLALRTALGSWRSPEAKSELVVFIISTCLAILYTAVICEEALRQSWIDAMPPDSPNLFFLDIQPHQVDDFKEMVGVPVEVFSNMRVRVLKVNGKNLDRSGKREYWTRDGRGKMDASPTRDLPENDKLLDGESVFQGEEPDQVSVREDMAEALEVGIGDRLTFGIQGVPVEARISSIRSSSRKGFRPRFELLFPPELVEGAPITNFASARLPEDEVGPLQTRLAKAFPGIVSMDLSLTIKLISERLIQMVGLVQYFLWSGLLAGLLILISATWSARQRRARESAFYKVMGADETFLHKVIWLENLALGFACSVVGLGIALSASAYLASQVLKVDFPSMSLALLVMLVVPTLAVGVLGWLVGRKIVSARPAPYLRAE